MIQGLYSAASGMNNQQKNIDVIANNIANINTVGFKSSRTDFKDALYVTMLNEATNAPVEKGTGVLLAGVRRNFTPSMVEITESPLDFAIEGDAFFSVQAPDGQILFKRDGRFAVSPESDGNYLVTSEGYYVLDSNGGKITVDGLPSEFNVSPEGIIQGGTQRLGIFNFANNEGLEAMGDNCFRATVASGAANVADEFTLKQGYVESSNVNIADEMVRLVKAQRAYQMSARAITLIDQMEANANNLRT